jgi:hypothetical protein
MSSGHFYDVYQSFFLPFLAVLVMGWSISKRESRIKDSSVLAGLEQSGLPLQIKDHLGRIHFLGPFGSFMDPSMGPKQLSRGNLDTTLWKI